jgi:hypothetical protein
VQRLRQAEPSWFRSGQTTTLFSSDKEKDPVSEARGGIPSCIDSPRGRGPCEAGSETRGGGRPTQGGELQWPARSSNTARREL